MTSLIRTALLGMCMGVAEVVPGVSGGTIAFIGGIYERLINAIRQFTPMLLVDLRRERLATVWQRVDGTFLVLLFSGMLLAIVLFASLIGYLMTNEPVALWSFFLGLVFASVWIVPRRVERFRLELLAPLILGSLCFRMTCSPTQQLNNICPQHHSARPRQRAHGGRICPCSTWNKLSGFSPQAASSCAQSTAVNITCRPAPSCSHTLAQCSRSSSAGKSSTK